MSASPNQPSNPQNAHAGHEHFSCTCGESFHSQAELKAHAQEFHAK